MSGTLFVICASSGAGKTSLVNYVLEQSEFAGKLERIITYTSRPMRQHELAGQDYHFVLFEEFEALIEQGFFLEWSNAYSSYYGTPSSVVSVLKGGKSLCVITDIAGALRLKQLVKRVCVIWIAVSSLALLHERLKKRGTETEAQIARRLELAERELAFVQENAFYSYLIVNDEWQNAALRLKNIIKNELNEQNFSKNDIFEQDASKVLI